MSNEKTIQAIIAEFPDFLTVQEVLTEEEVEQICNHYMQSQDYKKRVASLYDMWRNDKIGIDYQNDIDKNSTREFNEREQIKEMIEKAKERLKLKDSQEVPVTSAPTESNEIAKSDDRINTTTRMNTAEQTREKIIQEMIDEFPDFLAVQEALTKEDVEKICEHYMQSQAYRERVASLEAMNLRERMNIDYSDEVYKNSSKAYNEHRQIEKIIEIAKKKIGLQEAIIVGIAETVNKYGYPDELMSDMLIEVMNGNCAFITNDSGKRDILATMKPGDIEQVLVTFYGNHEQELNLNQMANMLLRDVYKAKQELATRKNIQAAGLENQEMGVR